MIEDQAKKYLEAIHLFQINKDYARELKNYLIEPEYNLTSMYCKGLVFLPTPNLIKQIQSEILVKYPDNRLNYLFNELTVNSKRFYTSLIKLIINTNNGSNFDGLYTIRIKPIGQKIINILKLIKYRIRYFDSKIEEQLSFNNSIMNGRFPCQKYYIRILGESRNWIFNILFNLRMNHEIIKLFYYLSTLFSIATFWGMSSNYINFHFGSNFIIYLKILISSVAVIISILSYPLEDFGNTDISGKDMVAYKYKTFFNNIDRVNFINRTGFSR